ncbi:hypothetical protein D9611_011513 [Ephemerocybe angulata]|uniref:SAP domain-containing protein n=1 Tax=Ephemerocybe angulata TaxID=980116 RepID=A0A8H5CD47_9AGAR|nr:hypothetical protein D9611_011513 [Tulosesus angulatus]
MASSPMVVDATEFIALPGPTYAEGNLEDVQHIELLSLKKDALSKLCKDVRLPYSGTKGVLHDRLREYSKDRSRWTMLLSRPSNMHLGPSEGRVIKHKKQSHKRWEGIQLADAAASSSVTLANAALVTHVDKHEATLAWAERVEARLPYKPRAERLAQDGPAPPLSNLVDGSSLILPSFPIPSSLSPPLPISVSAPVISSSAKAEQAEKPVEKPAMRKLMLASGQQLIFTSADIPPPFSATFFNDIPNLAAMWDDHWPEWKGESYLRIRGVAIPLVYCKEIYTAHQKGGDTAHWKSMKARWCEWKQIAVRFHQDTPQQFWSTFLKADGSHMDWTQILGVMRKQKAADDKRVADRARREYGASFPDHFAYKKNGVQYVFQKDADIAKRYKDIQGQGSQNRDESD